VVVAGCVHGMTVRDSNCVSMQVPIPVRTQHPLSFAAAAAEEAAGAASAMDGVLVAHVGTRCVLAGASRLLQRPLLGRSQYVQYGYHRSWYLSRQEPVPQVLVTTLVAASCGRGCLQLWRQCPQVEPFGPDLGTGIAWTRCTDVAVCANHYWRVAPLPGRRAKSRSLAPRQKLERCIR
jgi:hypothetical protein